MLTFNRLLELNFKVSFSHLCSGVFGFREGRIKTHHYPNSFYTGYCFSRLLPDHLPRLLSHCRGRRGNMVPANPVALPLQRPFQLYDHRWAVIGHTVHTHSLPEAAVITHVFFYSQPALSLSPYPWASTMYWSKSTFHQSFIVVWLSHTAPWTLHPPCFCRAHRSNTLKHSSLYEAFLPFLSPILLFVLSTIWVVCSPSNIIELQPRIYYLMVGTAFANVTVSVCCFSHAVFLWKNISIQAFIRVFIYVWISAFLFQCKLIVCQMSNTRCQPLSWLLLPMVAVVLLAVTGVFANETLLLYLWTAFVILAHIHYGVSVVRAHTQTNTQ